MYQRIVGMYRCVVRYIGQRKSRCGFFVLLIVLFCALIVASKVGWGWLQGDGESNSETLRNLGLVIAAVVALPLAIWRGVTADHQASIARNQADTARQILLNERYQKGAEMLGSSVLSVRMGGIHALQRLAGEHPEQFYVEIIQLLCTFARQPTEDREGERWQMKTEGKSDAALLSVRTDVQAIIAAVGCLRETGKELEKDGFRLDLRGANLRAGMFSRMDLSGALLGAADLSGAYLGEANLSGVSLIDLYLFQAKVSEGTWSANLSSALLAYANLSDAQLTWANLSGAELHKAILTNADLAGANLSGASLYAANLSGSDMYGYGDYYLNQPVFGVTQAQLDEACADPENLPELDGAVDAETNEQLVWRGKQPQAEALHAFRDDGRKI